MSDIVSFQPIVALDGNGVAVPGALAEFFESGTTTPETVFSDTALTTPLPWPVEANGEGRFPPIYHSGVSLKVVVKTPGGVVLPGYPVDPVRKVGTTAQAAQVSFTPSAEVPATTVQAAIDEVASQLPQNAVGAPGLLVLTAGGVLSRVLQVQLPLGISAPDGQAGNPGLSIRPLSLGEAIDPLSLVRGTVSGERLAEAHDARTVARRFESAEQALATTVDVAHGLGAVPWGMRAIIRCKTADLGYAVNDEVDVTAVRHTSGLVIHAAGADATNAFWRISSLPGLQLPNKATPATVAAITPASWRLVFRAWL